MKNLRRILALSLAVLAAATAARAAEWTDDYAAAVARAKKEHKLILLDFTGSDWCIWCKRTDDQVFSQQKFKDFADQKLVLVTVDFPDSKVLKDSVKAQNEKLKEKFGIQGFPTLIVLDSSEKVVFVQEGFKAGGPDAFIAEFPKSAVE